MFTFAARCVHAHIPIRFVAAVGLALVLAGCGDAKTPAEAPETHDHEGGISHAHDGEHAHQHAGDEEGPPPMDVGPEVLHGPHDGVVARLSTVDEPDFGFVELKLHDDKGDLELWLARDRDITKPFDLPVDAVLTVTFTDREDRTVSLRVREKVANLDEDGTPNVRSGTTNYFIFPGDSGADARWLRGAEFQSVVRVSFAHDGVAYVSDDFALRPHTHGGDHGHDHDGK